MPPALSHAALQGIGPTDEELLEAKKILEDASPSQKRSKMACMVAWVGKNPAGNEEVQESRGEARRRYLQIFLVHNMRHRRRRAITSA